jgi:hypothetical protein
MTTWETCDLYIAGYLLAQEFEVVSTRREGERVFFVFEDDEELRETVASWGTSQGFVVGHRYAHALRDLKYLVHRPTVERRR